MSNVSIFEKSWTDIVFEGRNKSYGAYQLRNESSKTTLIALFLGMLSIVSLGGIVLLIDALRTDVVVVKPAVIEEVITVSNYSPRRPEPPAANIPPAARQLDEDDTETENLTDPEIAEMENADEINNEPKPNTNPIGESFGTGSVESAAGTGTSTNPAIGTSIEPTDDNPRKPGELDRIPEFPGGIAKFYAYVSNNFEKPDIRDVKMRTVLLSFVIEKDGKMTDIKILRSAGREIDSEALRVLKSLHATWSPGIKDGQKVRTLYTLPITVDMK